MMKLKIENVEGIGPAELAKTVAEVGKAKHPTRRTPTEAEVTKWVAQAKTLSRMLGY